MRCLVTGGAGFIGSHLCDYLIAQNHEVICVDNFITGRQVNISHLLTSKAFHFIKHDVSQPLPDVGKIDIVYQLASPASPPKYQAYPIETLRVNTYGTYLLLELAKTHQARFIFASTSEAYGDPKEHPQTETYWGHVNPVGPRSCYDEAKRCGEAYVMAYFRKYRLDTRILRIFNTYGPRMDIDDGRVVTNFIKQILTSTPLTIHGDGQQTRSFCYISDLVSCIMTVAQAKNIAGEVYNVGNAEELTILELAKLLQEITGTQLSLQHTDLPVDDPIRRRPDLTKIFQLGWQPKISLREGMMKTWKSFQEKA